VVNWHHHGIRVHETLPDSPSSAVADEESCAEVDTPADRLIGRLKAGKFTTGANGARRTASSARQPDGAARFALSPLYRGPGRTDVQAYRVSSRSMPRPCGNHRAALLCAIPSPRDGDDHVVRSAARLSQQLAVAWRGVRRNASAAAAFEREAQTHPANREARKKNSRRDGGSAVSATRCRQRWSEHARHHNLSEVVMGHNEPRVVAVLAAWEKRSGGATAHNSHQVRPDRGRRGPAQWKPMHPPASA
jgi:two-component system sensor histidine kinase KdpD